MHFWIVCWLGISPMNSMWKLYDNKTQRAYFVSIYFMRVSKCAKQFCDKCTYIDLRSIYIKLCMPIYIYSYTVYSTQFISIDLNCQYMLITTITNPFNFVIRFLLHNSKINNKQQQNTQTASFIEKLRNVFTGSTYKSCFWVVHSFLMFTCLLFQIKLHLISSVLLGGFQSSQCSEVTFTGLAGTVNATIYNTEPIFTGLWHGKFPLTLTRVYTFVWV